MYSCRARLAKLVRFHSSKSPANLTSLDGYVSRMQPGQKSIYWIAGMNQEEVAGSPFAEKLVAEVRAAGAAGLAVLGTLYHDSF
jgi:HSP90 family molecular chaperone